MPKNRASNAISLYDKYVVNIYDNLVIVIQQKMKQRQSAGCHMDNYYSLHFFIYICMYTQSPSLLKRKSSQ